MPWAEADGVESLYEVDGLVGIQLLRPTRKGGRQRPRRVPVQAAAKGPSSRCTAVLRGAPTRRSSDGARTGASAWAYADVGEHHQPNGHRAQPLDVEPRGVALGRCGSAAGEGGPGSARPHLAERGEAPRGCGVFLRVRGYAMGSCAGVAASSFAFFSAFLSACPRSRFCRASSFLARSAAFSMALSSARTESTGRRSRTAS